jgi:Family of unknown function (DUF6428)
MTLLEAYHISRIIEMKGPTMTLDDLLASMQPLPADLPLVFMTEDGPVGAGYHVTELKLANLVSIDCGARTSAWSESVLQLLDGQGRGHMPVGKFLGILKQSLRKVDGLGAAPAFVEFGHRNAGMQIFRLSKPELDGNAVTLRLEPVRAHCKPALDARQSRDAKALGADGCGCNSTSKPLAEAQHSMSSCCG